MLAFRFLTLVKFSFDLFFVCFTRLNEVLVFFGQTYRFLTMGRFLTLKMKCLESLRDLTFHLTENEHSEFNVPL